jgi:5-bromo-4-chloroindolyl phosphate hydrolysis protein
MFFGLKSKKVGSVFHTYYAIRRFSGTFIEKNEEIAKKNEFAYGQFPSSVKITEK